jgi:hypothetical protein
MAFIRMKESLWHAHKNCPVKIDYNYQPKKSKYKAFPSLIHVQPALVCASHNKWLKWLSHDEIEKFKSVAGDEL